MDKEAERDVTIRRVKEEDIPKLVELYLKAYKGLEEYAYTHPKDVKSYMEWLVRRDPEGFLVAETGGKPVGFIGADANWFSRREGKLVGAVHEIVVDPEYRSRGIGKALMRSALDYFKKRGRDTAELWVGDKNTRAINFYKKLGFREEGRYNYWIRMKRGL
ncbi:MAG: GNAT family N-acetyltransferase [Aquificae bacterium]|nr:GNAT family N-acetyltransferase [Aquificota bacterium]